MKYGYARVSTSLQDTTLQAEALRAAGCGIVVEETMSGAKWGTDRQAFQDLLDRLTAGDSLVVYKLDRLGRSTIQVIETVMSLVERGVNVQCLTGLQLDTASAGGRLVLHIMAAFSEFERAMIRERCQSGIDAVKAGKPTRTGRPSGRPRTVSDEVVCEILRQHAAGANFKNIAINMQLSASTVRDICNRSKP